MSQVPRNQKGLGRRPPVEIPNMIHGHTVTVHDNERHWEKNPPYSKANNQVTESEGAPSTPRHESAAYSSPFNNDRGAAVVDHEIDLMPLGRVFEVAGEMASIHQGRRISPGRLIVVGGEGVKSQAIRFPEWIVAIEDSWECHLHELVVVRKTDMAALLESYSDKFGQQERDAMERENWIKKLEEENARLEAEREASLNQ